VDGKDPMGLPGNKLYADHYWEKLDHQE